MKNLLFFCVYLLFNPRFLKPLLQNIYLPVLIQFEWLSNRKLATVIDVGAYKGHISLVLKYLFPNIQIYAFEPSNEILNLDKKNLSNTTIERLAVGDKIGDSIFYKSSYAPASSLLPLGKFYRDKFKVAEQTKVEVTTLDRYFLNKILKKPIILKIDTQGMDGAVLRGGEKLLKSVDIVHVEAPFKELYKNQDSFRDIYDFLIKRNFTFIGSIPDSDFFPNFNPPDAANCIFLKVK